MKKKLLCFLLLMAMIVSSSTNVLAYNGTGTDTAYSYYYGKSMADLEARIWLSTGSISYAKNTFDAKSSSWVFNLMDNVYITKHKNTMTLNKTMFGVSLSVSGSGASGSITRNDGNIFSQETPEANSYYRGLDCANCILTFPPLTVQACSVTGTSGQRVFIDGQLFNNQADCTGVYLGPKII